MGNEKAPEQGIEKIVDLAKTATENPAELAEKIKDTTETELNELAKRLLETQAETKKEVSEVAKNAIREQFEKLRANVESSESVDDKLAALRQRFAYLVTLLEVRPPKKKLSFIDRMMSKETWTKSLVTAYEKVTSTILGSLGGIAKTLHLESVLRPITSYGERLALGINVQAAIEKEKLLGEEISFSANSVSLEELDELSADATKSKKLPELVKNYLKLARSKNVQKDTPLAPISFTLSDLLHPETLQAEIAKTGDSAALERAKTEWGTTVRFGDKLGAKREQGKWVVMTPRNGFSSQLKKAMEAITTDKITEISIGTGNETKIDLATKKLELAPGIELPEAFNAILENIHLDTVSTITLTATRTPFLSFNPENGMLKVNANAEMLTALSGQFPQNLLENVNVLTKLQYEKGQWKTVNPQPITPPK